jgi:hypothetical protein
MSSKVFVAVFTCVRDRECEVIGAFRNEKSALLKTFDFLVDKEVILQYDAYLDTCEDGEEMDVNEYHESFRTKLETIKDLEKLSRTHGDTYYTEEWWFDIKETNLV